MTDLILIALLLGSIALLVVALYRLDHAAEDLEEAHRDLAGYDPREQR